MFSVKYSTDKGKTVLEEFGFKCGSDAVDFAWKLKRKGAVIYGIFRDNKQI